MATPGIFPFKENSNGRAGNRTRDIISSQHRRCCLQAASSMLYTTSCKHSLVLLRISDIIARNMLGWLKLLIKLLLLHLVGCLYYYINDARSHKHQIFKYNSGYCDSSLCQYFSIRPVSIIPRMFHTRHFRNTVCQDKRFSDTGEQSTENTLTSLY